MKKSELLIIPTVFRLLFIILIIIIISFNSACKKADKEEPDKNLSQEETITYSDDNSVFSYPEYNINDVILKAEITLTNSTLVNHENFPEAECAFLHIGFESPPPLLVDTTPWVIFGGGSFSIEEMFGLSIHLPNLEDTYEVHIYDNGLNLFRKYTAKKDEVTLDDFQEFYDEKELEKIKKVLPFYTFYFPAWVSHSKQLFKTEICSINGDVLYSTYIDYPSIPFIVSSSPKGGRLLQYSGDNPVYIVLYEETDDRKRYEEGDPIKAFSITPINGYWEGILNIIKNKPTKDLGIILFKMDPDNPDDYSKPISGVYKIYY